MIYESQYYSHSYLAHFGIKGMRWGVRRYQNPDGSLTSAGEKRYNNDDISNTKQKKKSLYYRATEQKYKKKGLSDEDAARAAEKKTKVAKGLLIGAVAAGLTVAGVAAYKKYSEEYIGKVIKSGTTLQTLASDPNRLSYGQEFYASYIRGDKNLYIGKFGKSDGQLKYNIKQKVKDGIKVAPNKEAVGVFKDIYNENPSFREYLYENKNLLANNIKGRHSIEYDGNITDFKKAYSIYNQLLVDHRPDAEKFKTEFYKRLGSKGYDAIIDLNDRYFSGFKAKSPVIVFNKGKANVEKNVEKLTENKYNLLRNVDIGKQIVKQFSPQLTLSGISALILAGEKYDDKIVKEYKSSRTG